MPEQPHLPVELEALCTFTVPTLANAIETFGVIPANTGFCDSTLRCHYPDMPLMLGYAVTARVSTNQPEHRARPPIAEADYWRFIASRPVPKVAAVEDVDRPPKGAMWGEWNSHVHKALGCVGMVTEGAARDLDGVAKLNFSYFSTSILPTHGYGAFIEFGGPVTVAGLELRTGDLLAGDRHGVILIPPEIPLAELARVAAEIDQLEERIFSLCRSAEFTLEKLIDLDAEIAAAWPQPPGKGTA